MVRYQHRSLLSLLPCRLRFPSSQHSFLNASLLSVQATNTSSGPSKKQKRSSDSPFKQAVIFLSRNPPQKCLIANLPRILYLLDSKTIIYLKNYLSCSNNLYVPHTTQNGHMMDKVKIFEYNI